MHFRSRALVSAALSLGLGAGALSPVAASDLALRTDPPDDPLVWDVLGGNFAGDQRDEIFLYNSGDTPDTLVSWSNGGVFGGPLSARRFAHGVAGQYQPVVGDFDGDGYDEIVWYAAGPAPDSMWNFASFATHVSAPMTVNGYYDAVAGDFTGDGTDDIFWYGPGATPDTLWEFDRGGTHIAVSFTVRDHHLPLVASIGKDATDDLLWYTPAAATSPLWDFTRGTTTYTTSSVAISNGYSPFALDIFGDGPRGEDIYWYHPGPFADEIWDHQNGVRRAIHHVPLGDTWRGATGDLFGDGHDDVHLVDPEVGETLRDLAVAPNGPGQVSDRRVELQAEAIERSDDEPEGALGEVGDRGSHAKGAVDR